MGKKLNDSQKMAVFHKEGPMLVLAGPGSGKTTVILSRANRLLSWEKIEGEVLVVTFTKAAATQMQERFAAGGGRGAVHFATFHSVFFRMLRQAYGYGVNQLLGEEERRKWVLEFLSQQEWGIQDPEEFASQFLLQASLVQNELMPLTEFVAEGMEADEFRTVYKAYGRHKERQNKLDFDDMLSQCYYLLLEEPKVLEFWRKKYPYIMVDEFQDVNRAQYECLRLLAAPKNNLFVVGDDDQSIYGFRGARPDFLLEFEKGFPACKKVTLHINYRSTHRILSLAERVIRENTYRFDKGMEGVRGEGEKVVFFLAEDSTEEAETVAEKISGLLDEEMALEEIAVIYRTNIQSGTFARALYRRGIPYILRDGGGNIYEHWIAKDLLAYLYLAENPEADGPLRRILNKPKRYIGKDLQAEAEKMPYTLLRSFFVCPSLKKWQEEHLENLRLDLAQVKRRKPYEALQYIRRVIGYDEYLEEYAAYRHSSAQTLLEIADELTETAKGIEDSGEFQRHVEEMSLQMQKQMQKKDAPRKGVMLSTMHGAKGLEFEAVFLPSLLEGIVPHEKSGEENIEEERRLFYVALTRTKERLWLSAIRKKQDKEKTPSRFLKEMGLDVEALFKEKD